MSIPTRAALYFRSWRPLRLWSWLPSFLFGRALRTRVALYAAGLKKSGRLRNSIVGRSAGSLLVAVGTHVVDRRRAHRFSAHRLGFSAITGELPNTPASRRVRCRNFFGTDMRRHGRGIDNGTLAHCGRVAPAPNTSAQTVRCAGDDTRRLFDTRRDFSRRYQMVPLQSSHGQISAFSTSKAGVAICSIWPRIPKRCTIYRMNIRAAPVSCGLFRAHRQHIILTDRARFLEFALSSKIRHAYFNPNPVPGPRESQACSALAAAEKRPNAQFVRRAKCHTKESQRCGDSASNTPPNRAKPPGSAKSC